MNQGSVRDIVQQISVGLDENIALNEEVRITPSPDKLRKEDVLLLFVVYICLLYFTGIFVAMMGPKILLYRIYGLGLKKSVLNLYGVYVFEPKMIWS